MSDVNINLGTDGSTISDSKVSIGDIGNLESKRIVDLIWSEIQDVKIRLKAVEIFLAGSLGEPGLTGQVGRIKDDIRRIERAIEILKALDDKTDRFADALNRYDPMWRAMEASYSSKVNVPVYVFYGVMFLLVVSIVVTALIIGSSRG